jgi:integrase
MALKLVRRHRGKNWYIRGTVAGCPVDESTRTADRKVAEKLLAKRSWELQEASIFGRKAVATYLEAVYFYLQAGGEKRYQARLVEHFGNTPLAQIDQNAIDRTARLLLPRASPATRNRQVYTPISAVLKDAAKRKMCEWRQIERPSQPPGRVRYLTPPEADSLISACETHLRPLVIFLFYTGCRVGEALHLDWREVDVAGRQVQFLKTKNGKARGVPLHPRILDALGKLPHREGRVFRRPDGEPYAETADRAASGGSIKTAFRAACRRAGITDFTPHDCRHTFASWHYAANRNLAALMEIGGWNSERMLLRYTHVNVGHLIESIDVLPWRGKSGEPEFVPAVKKANSKT